MNEQKQEVTVDRVIAKYIEDRDRLAVFKAEYEEKCHEVKAVQEKREKWLMGQLDKLGSDSIRAKGAGTCFISFKESATVADREAFFAWVNEDWGHRAQFLENRVSKAAVKSYNEDEGSLPPGVDFKKFKTVQVRRA